MMPRDLDLIRELLLRFEHDDTSLPTGRTRQEVAYHVKQMKLSGLIDAKILEQPFQGKLAPFKFIIHDVTPAGHDFIAALKKDGIWSKVKAEAQKKLAPLTLELVIALAKKFGKDALGL